jgi:hypothetical protein
VAALLAGAAPASASQLLTNGDFETGTLEGWTAVDPSGGEASWTVASRAQLEALPGFYLPPSGNYFAYGLIPSAPGAAYLYQDVTLPAASTDQLSMYLYYVAESPSQGVRVDVMKPEAPIGSLAPSDILATVYARSPADPLTREPTLITADLSGLAGQTVRLRIAAESPSGTLRVGADDASIDSTPLPAPAPAQPSAAPPLPSNAFSIGKLFRDRRHGAAKLAVTLPGAGTVTVTDARRQVASASARTESIQTLPTLIRTASVQTTDPRTVRVLLRPTATAKRLLAQAGRLPFRLQLTFTPDRGMTATQPYRGTLVKALKRARR